MQDQRRDELRQWVLRYADEQNINIDDDFSFEPLSGDASFRRYFRVQFSATSLLAVDAPPDAEDSLAFVKIASLLRDNGVKVPAIFAVDYQQGFLLVTDFGDQLYEKLLASSTINELYFEALRVLVKMQSIPSIADRLPTYDEELLQTELAHFPRWFYQELLGKSLNVKDKLIIKEFDTVLLTTILQQPYVFVHRDYHCRNLLLTNLSEAAVIDFQGATCGPITYDLVSLLKDCYVKWPDPFIQQSIDYYLLEAEKFGVLSNIDRELFIAGLILPACNAI